MTQFLLKHKKPLGITLAVIALVLFIYLMGRRSAKRVIGQKARRLPKDKDWGKSLSEEDSQLVRRIAAGLHEDMDGLNVFTRKIDRWEEYQELNDELFIAVYNDFNEAYGEGDTLREWVESEHDAGFNMGFSSWDDVKGEVLRKMDRLNLS